MTSKTIFDEIEYTPYKTSTIFDEIEYTPPKSQLKRKAGVATKAFASGLGGAYGDILDLLRLQPKEILPGEQIVRDREFEALQRMEEKGYKPKLSDILALSDDDEIVPRYSRTPNTEEVAALLKSDEPEDITERFIERAGKGLGGGAALGGGLKTLLALLSGSVAGQATKELGFPEPLADVVDVGTTLLTGKPSKKLIPKKQQQKFVESLRAKGFTDKEIAPLIQGEKKLRRLGKIATKDEKNVERIKQIKNRIGDIYTEVKETGEGLKGLGRGTRAFEEKIGTQLKDIRPSFKRLIKDELNDLAITEHKIPDLINFYQDINQKVKGVEGGKAILNKLKGPVLEAIEEISPKAAEDFKLANELYSKMSKVSQALKPGTIEEWLNKGNIYGLAVGLATLNPGILKKLLTVGAAKRLSRALLIDPRLQNFSTKIAQNVQKNKPAAVRSMMRNMSKYVQKKYPDISKEFDSAMNDQNADVKAK